VDSKLSAIRGGSEINLNSFPPGGVPCEETFHEKQIVERKSITKFIQVERRWKYGH
jgi:hypothetical protein